MEVERINDITEYELELLKNQALIDYCDLVFDYSDFEDKNGVCDLKFYALKNSRCKIVAEFSLTGKALIYFNGVPYPASLNNGQNLVTMEVNALCGENVLRLDYKEANAYRIGEVGVSGYVKRIYTGSKISCCEFDSDYFLASFDALKKTAKVTLYSNGASYDLVYDSFDDFALAKVSANEVVAAGIAGGYMHCYLLSATARDVMGTRSFLCNAVSIGGVDGGMVVINDKNAIVKYAFSSLDATASDTGLKAKRIISAPDANDIILIGIDDKAKLCQINFPQ